MSSKDVRGASRAVIGVDMHGEKLFAEAVYASNAADIGSMGRGIYSSGITVKDEYVEVGGSNSGLAYRKVLAIYNNGADTLFIGESGQGIGNMYPLAGSGGQMSFNATSGVRIYVLTDGTDVDMRFIEMG